MIHLLLDFLTSEVMAALVGGLIMLGGTYFGYYLNRRGKLIFAVDRLIVQGIKPDDSNEKGVPWEMTLGLIITNDSGKYEHLKISDISIKAQGSFKVKTVIEYSPKRLLFVLPPKCTKPLDIDFIHFDNNPVEIILMYENLKGQLKKATCFISEDDIQHKEYSAEHHLEP